MTLEPEEGGKWRIARPGPLSRRRRSGGRHARQARAAAYASSSPLRSRRRRTARQAGAVTLWLGKDKDRTSKTLCGKVDADKKGVYAQREGEKDVLLVPSRRGIRSPRRSRWLVTRRSSPTPTQGESGGGRERGGQGHARARRYSLEDHRARALKADPGAVNGLLWRLRDLRASGFLDESAAGISAISEARRDRADLGRKAPRSEDPAPRPLGNVRAGRSRRGRVGRTTGRW